MGMERLRAQGALQGDAVLAVFLSGGFAVAVVLISLARGFNADLFAITLNEDLARTSGVRPKAGPRLGHTPFVNPG
jgi:zinc transport system permease protein